jgi:large subunit ribosomal protein L13
MTEKKILNKTITNSTKTTRPKVTGLQRAWYVVDASKAPLGRISTIVANLLTGKNRADYSPDVDMGACVVVINSSKTVLTGKKPQFKTYFRHSKRIGSLKSRSFQEVMELDATRPVYLSVKRMLPKNRHNDNWVNNRLHIFEGESVGITQQLIPAN